MPTTSYNSGHTATPKLHIPAKPLPLKCFFHLLGKWVLRGFFQSNHGSGTTRSFKEYKTDYIMATQLTFDNFLPNKSGASDFFLFGLFNNGSFAFFISFKNAQDYFCFFKRNGYKRKFIKYFYFFYFSFIHFGLLFYESY